MQDINTIEKEKMQEQIEIFTRKIEIIKKQILSLTEEKEYLLIEKFKLEILKNL